MLSIDQTLAERLPWLGQHPLIRKPLVGMLEKLAHESRFNQTLDHAGTALCFHFCRRPLDYLGVSCRITERERENIPVEGPLLVVANHPLGMGDAIALLQMIGSVGRAAARPVAPARGGVRQGRRLEDAWHLPQHRSWRSPGDFPGGRSVPHGP